MSDYEPVWMKAGTKRGIKQEAVRIAYQEGRKAEREKQAQRLALLEAVVEAAAKLMAELNDGGIKSIATEDALETALRDLDNYDKEARNE